MYLYQIKCTCFEGYECDNLSVGEDEENIRKQWKENANCGNTGHISVFKIDTVDGYNIKVEGGSY